jgi:hypothetical protein
MNRRHAVLRSAREWDEHELAFLVALQVCRRRRFQALSDTNEKVRRGSPHHRKRARGLQGAQRAFSGGVGDPFFDAKLDERKIGHRKKL